MMLTNSYDHEDFVTTQIKCPPPKIIAVKRSLKRRPLSLQDTQNFMDDEDLLMKKDLDFINDDDDSFSSIESKDLIEFEPDEPLIDLSDVTDGENGQFSEDTINDKNARNSSTLTSLLELLEVGNVTRTTETETLGSCAEDASCESDSSTPKKSSSSSLLDIPVNDVSACAISSGKTDELSTVFPPLSFEQEKPSLAKSIGHNKVKFSSEIVETFDSRDSEDSALSDVQEEVVAKIIDSTLQKLNQCQSENLDCENSISTSINLLQNLSNSIGSKEVEQSALNECKASVEQRSEDKEKENKENSVFCHNHHQKETSSVSDVNSIRSQIITKKKSESFNESSDSNNNRESVCNQNSLSSLSLGRSLLANLAKFNVDEREESEEGLKFLSPHTSQRKLPPKFFSSTNSLNQDVNFEASSRLKRLEERFKGFSYTKKLLRNSKVFSKSEEILSSIGRAKQFKSCEDPLNSSLLCSLSSTTLSENCLRRLTENEYVCNGHHSVDKNIGKENNNLVSTALSKQVNEEFSPPTKNSSSSSTFRVVQSPESTTESEEICKIFHEKDNKQTTKKCIESDKEVLNNQDIEEENCSFVYFEEEPGDRSLSVEDDTTNKASVFNEILFSNCEFDADTFNQYLNDSNDSNQDEDDDDDEENEHRHQKHCREANCNSDDEKSDESDFFCDCLVESVPLYHSNIMRETGGKLRGLLKPPNRPPPTRKNRVVFDETRNEFFEADYIILIREDCPYDEEDEEPCTCGDHELVRICCDEGCNCGYTDDGRTPPSPKFAPPIEFVDQATLSPPEGYKDSSLIDSALSGALGNHVFGAQHIQQLQVIQRLQQQRAAMLAARAAAANVNSQSTNNQNVDPQGVCTECAECAECAAAKLAELEGECDSQCSEDPSPMEVVSPHVLAIGSLVPVQKSSPEKRHQKEIVAGEERPKFLSMNQTEDAQAKEDVKNSKVNEVKPDKQESVVVETITMTTVTEHRIIQAAEDATNPADIPPPKPPKAVTLQPPAIPEGRLGVFTPSQSVEAMKNDLNATVIPKFSHMNGTAQAITGILKGGKLRKTDSINQNDETSNTTSDEETSSRRSVRFNEETSGEGEGQNDSTATDEEGNKKSDNKLTDYVTHMSLKRHTSLFHNALRPNSAVRQLFPAKTAPLALTHEALMAIDGTNLLSASQTITSGGSSSSTSTSPTPLTHSASDTDTIKRTIERNALRRSLIKYEPKKKPTTKEPSSLEERIRLLTCDIDEPGDSEGNNSLNVSDIERRDSPAGEENPQQTKFDKSFSPSSSTSSSSSCSGGSTYKKITDLFSKEKRHEKIVETDENPIVIIPQDCRCPAGPDIGMAHQIQGVHTQIHQPPNNHRHDSKRHILSNTLAPLTACVAGQREDSYSYYMIAKPGDRTSTASSQTADQYSIGDIDAALQDNDTKKVAPDVIAGTPGQESDELASFAQQEANRLDRIKKRYSSDSAPASNVNSDDDEQNDYGFNKRPSVRGIKPRFGSTNEILQQMQDQLSQPTPNLPPGQVANPNQGQSATLPRTNASGTLQLAQNKQQQQQQQQQQPQNLAQQQQQQQQNPQQQHMAMWTYVPEQPKKAGDPHGNYYHLPAHSRHSYHGHEAIYQNCHTMTVQQTQAIIPGHVHQKLTQQTSQPHFQAIQHAQQYTRLNQYARSPTRRPESPPPLRNYHQTMVLIPYKPDETGYAAYGITGETTENIYQRQNIVEYQQVTQQTIRVPIGYPMPGMQLHVVPQPGVNRVGPHYATLPRQNSAQGQQKFAYPMDKPSMERGVPEGEAASVPQSDIMPPSTCQDGESMNNNSAVPGTVYYAMNV